MEELKSIKTTTYAVGSEFFVDIVETDEHFHAYIYRENGFKRSMYLMNKSIISRDGFVRKVGRDAPGYENIYDCEREWFMEIPDDWYDDADDEYDDEYDDEEDGFENEHDCENCEHRGDCELEDLKGMTIEVPELEGSEEECEAADEIREMFVSWMNNVFLTKHPRRLFSFQQWFLLHHDSAAYWIEHQDSLFDMIFLADSVSEWRSEENVAIWEMGED